MVTVFAAPAYADHATRTDTSNLVPLGDVPSGDLDAEVEPADSTFNTDLAFKGNMLYQGNYNGFRIIDVTNKAAPVLLKRLDNCDGSQGDVMIYDELLIRSWDVSSRNPLPNPPGPHTCAGQTMVQGEEGLHIFDVSDPANPVLIDFIDLVAGSHTATLVPDEENGRLFVYNGPSSGGAASGIDIVEIELDDDPATADTDERGQATLVRRENTNRSCHDNAVYLGDVLKAVCAGGNGFTVLSMDPADGGSLTNPAFMYSRAVQDVTIGHAATFANDGETFVFGHEPGGGSAAECADGDPDAFRTFFYFDTSSGEQVGKWEIPNQSTTENCTPHNLNVIPTTDGSDIMVSGNYQAGTWVTDFTDPQEPVVLAHSDPPPLSPTQLILGGAWSTYWYNGYLYESDITKGLHIFQMLNPGSAATAQDVPYMNPQTQLERPAQSTTSASSVTIAHSDSPHRFSGKVSSEDAGCVAGRKVTVRKAQDGRDMWIGAATTGAQGGYNVAHKRGGAGRYYAVVQKSTVQDGIDTTTCQWGDSDRIRVDS
jgi:hypothetical protein